MAQKQDEQLDGRTLDDLYQVILSRKDDDPTASHTAKLFARGIGKIAQKTGEEAVEVVIEAVAGEQQALAEESADLLYHLLVLWAAREVPPEMVWQTLSRRKGVSGLVEKAQRPKN